MKNILLSIFFGFSITANTVEAQCSATAPSAFMNCSYYGDRITAFSLNSIASSGNAGCGTNGYNLFSTPVRTLTMGNTYNWTASTGYYYSQGLGIWVDWNNDGLYTAAEMVAARSYAFSHSGSFSVPYTAVVGTNIRMRVRCSQYYTFTSSTSPCNSLYGYGETEDYYLYIACPSSLPPLTVSSTGTYVCSGQSVTMTATGAQVYTVTGGSGGVSNGVGFNPTSTANYTITGGISACPSVTNSAVQTISVSNTQLNISTLASPTTVCAGKPSVLTAIGANNFTWTPGNYTGSSVTVGPVSSKVYTVYGYNGLNTGCGGTATVALNVIQPPTINAASTSSTVCAGRSVTLTASGAQSYTWEPGGQTATSITVAPAVSTIYKLTGANASGCTTSTQTYVAVSQAPDVKSTASSMLVCPGEAVTLTGSGANTYTWVNQSSGNPLVVNPTVSTTYSVIGLHTSTGCDNMSTVHVNVYNPVTTISSNASVCVGTTIKLNATGGNSYTWTPGNTNGNQLEITPTADIVYQVTINSFSVINCQTVKSVTVDVLPSPDVKAVATPTSVCKFESMQLSATGASNYTWTNGSNASSLTLVPTVANTQFFIVTGVNSDNCVGYDTLLLRVNNCTALKELNAGSTLFSVYPNPSTGNFKVYGQKKQDLVLVNQLGEEVRRISLNDENHMEVNVENLSSGIYFLVGITEGEVNVTKKIVVTK